MRYFHRILHYFFCFLVKFLIEVVFHIPENALKFFIDFVYDVVEIIVAELFEEMTDLIHSLLFGSGAVEVAETNHRKGNL